MKKLTENIICWFFIVVMLVLIAELLRRLLIPE